MFENASKTVVRAVGLVALAGGMAFSAQPAMATSEVQRAYVQHTIDCVRLLLTNPRLHAELCAGNFRFGTPTFSGPTSGGTSSTPGRSSSPPPPPPPPVDECETDGGIITFSSSYDPCYDNGGGKDKKGKKGGKGGKGPNGPPPVDFVLY